MDKENVKSIIESLLFVSGEPIKFSKIAKICGVSKEDVVVEINNLENDYFQKNSGLSVVRKGDSVQLVTNSKSAEFVSKLVKTEQNSEISRSALEVLSIVAYRGPITRTQIEIIRGVNCSYVLRTLMIKGLIERKETSDIRGYLYEVSFEFLKSLGIGKLEDLPDWENLSKNEKISELLQESEDIEKIGENNPVPQEPEKE